jgi:hypothetical protein
MFHHLGRPRTGVAEPYSNAAQTNIVINYHGVPTVLIGEGAFLPSLDISVSSFLEFPMHALCGYAGDQLTTVAWASAPPEGQLQLLTIPFIRAFTLPPIDKLAAFVMMMKTSPPPISLHMSSKASIHPTI